MVPMKPLALSKTRLSGALTTPQRMALSRNMLRHVLRATLGTPRDRDAAGSVESVWVLGGDSEVSEMARDEGANWFEEEGSDINETLELGFRRAFESGRAALFLPGDLPFLTTRDVMTMVDASGQGKNIALAPARGGGGTNGILVPPHLPRPYRPMLGTESFKRHLDQAASSLLPVAICYSPGLACDLDTVEDLEAYERRQPDVLKELLEGRTKERNRIG